MTDKRSFIQADVLKYQWQYKMSPSLPSPVAYVYGYQHDYEP